ncbi:MAG TPA: amino acid adenylation domain-containing protein, partial [Verrucomicrobiales bacterium]|nr:amino acid adenylation domain-containing protein [Verrucomicrobiales bacterium]
MKPSPHPRILPAGEHRSSVPFRLDRCVHQLFEEQALRSPDAIAVEAGVERVSYGELNARANRLAHRLCALGVRSDTLVGLCTSRSIDMVVGMLGILKSGAAFLPLDAAHPAARLAFMLTDAGAGLVVTQSALLDRLPAREGCAICLDRDLPPDLPGTNPGRPVQLSHLAYAIFTSGSTGLPKAAAIEHLGFTNLVQSHWLIFSDSAEDRFSQFANVAFDAVLFEVWPCLTMGATLRIVDDAVRSSATAFRDWLVEHAVSVAFAPTPLAEEMLELNWPPTIALRCFILAGSKMHRAPRQALPFTVHNVYGPTETSVWATQQQVDSQFEKDAPPPIGVPIPNVRAFVLDAQQNPLEPGAPGELYLGGVSVGRGYLNRPELTAERFLPDPFAETANARIYRTGDLVRWRDDGTLDFIGRVDDQVKIRGFRVELGEIETALRTHPAVREAAVAAWPAGTGLRLAAYVASQDSLAAADLIQHLRASLPDYMIPSTFEFLASLPKTSSGKLDRQALPEPSSHRPQLDTPYAAPRTPLERLVASTWRSALGLDSVGIDDHFFALGGSSLLATHILAQLREHGGWDLPPGTIFERPTIVLLCELLAEPAECPAEPITTAPRDAPLPLSYSQERVWLLERWDPGNRAYQVQAILGIQGTLNLSSLEQALGALVQRHEILRTTFPDSSQGPVQSIHPPFSVRLEVEDLSSLPEPERAVAVNDIVRTVCQEPFDLDRLPLIRWKLLRIAPEDHRLIQVEHHLIHDGWSFNLLLRELVELYRAFDTGTPLRLSPPSLQFADFACWQRRYVESGVGEQQAAFWRRTLAGCPAELDLPFDRPRPSRQSYRGAAPTIELSGTLMQGLAALSRREGVTLFDTMLAAFAALLHRLTGQDDLCIGSGVANRRWKPVEEIAGMIVNNVVLRMSFNEDDGFRDVLRRAQHQKTEAYAHQDAPFEQIVRALNPDRDPSRHPLFQVMFSFHDSPLGNLRLPGLVFQEPRVLSNDSAKFDLNVVVIPRHGGQDSSEVSSGTVVWEYNSDLFDPETIERMLTAYRLILEAVLTDPSQSIAGLPLLTEAQRKQILAEWNDTTTPYPRDSTIHELFEEQAAAQHDALALTCGQDQLSYGELNARANQLARHLQKLGAGPETVVALCLERSLDLVVALLGILKAGGAYLPLDPGYPTRRLEFMQRDAGASLLLTHSRLLDRLPTPYPAPVLCLDALQSEIARQDTGNLAQISSAESLAYLIYTSGSTGFPNGTAIPHRAVVRLVRNTNYITLEPSDVLLQFSTVSFDASTFEVWGSLLNG